MWRIALASHGGDVEDNLPSGDGGRADRMARQALGSGSASGGLRRKRDGNVSGNTPGLFGGSGEFSFELDGVDDLIKQIKLLTLSSKDKRRYHFLLGNEVKKYARKHIREQRSPDGSPFHPRKRGKRKLLRRMAKSGGKTVMKNHA